MFGMSASLPECSSNLHSRCFVFHEVIINADAFNKHEMSCMLDKIFDVQYRFCLV